METVRAGYYPHHSRLQTLAIGLGHPLGKLRRLARNADEFSQDAWLEYALNGEVPPFLPMYLSRSIKTKGQRRTVWVPCNELMDVQRAIAVFLLPAAEQTLHEYAHGYVAGRSTVTNAQPHCGAPWVQKFDIEDFFGSTTRLMVHSILRALGLSHHGAKLLASLTTFQNSLPLGAPSSPVLSNLLLAEADQEISVECAAQGIAYTRYADDLTFSHDASFDLTEFVTGVVTRRGYCLNTTKSLLKKRGQAVRVTGLTVWDGTFPRLPKSFKRRLRQEMYYVSKYGLESHADREYDWPWIDEEFVERSHEQSEMHLRGKIRYARGVEPAWIKKLQENFSEVELLKDARNFGERNRERSLIFRSLVSEIDQTAPLDMKRWVE